MAEGLQKIPLRIPKQWDAAWFERFCREVLALADIRNAIAGTGVQISGQPGEVATISASDDFQNLLNVPFVTLDASSILTNERVLDAGPGITLTDGGAGSTIKIGVDSGALFGSLNAFTVIGNPFEVSGPSIQISGNVEGDVLTIQDVSGDPAVVWTNTPIWSGRHTWINADDSATVLVSNAFDPGAGVELSTSGAGAFGINAQLAFWEQSSKLYGFRWYMDGSPVNQAYLDLYRHENNALGASVLRVTRTTGYVDLYTRLQLADGSSALPSLTFTSDDDLGLFRRGSNDLGIAAQNTRIVSGGTSGGGIVEVILELQHTLATGFETLSFTDNAGTRQMNIAFGNGSASLPNVGFIHMAGGQDFLLRSSGTERWRMLGASGNFRSADNVELQLGAGPDLRLFHDGTNSTIRNDTGDLLVLSGAVERYRVTASAESIRVTGAANQLGILVNANATTGQSFGQRINAGTNTADYAIRIANQAGTTDYFRVRGDGRTYHHDGSNALPSISFLNDPDSGLYLIGADNAGMATGGTLRSDWRSDGGFNHAFSLQWSGEISPTQLTADTDNWAPTNLANARTVRVSTDASRNLTGITGGRAGRELVLLNVGANDIVLVHDATSTAANRLLLPGAANMTLSAGSGVTLWYDNTSSRWRPTGRSN